MFGKLKQFMGELFSRKAGDYVLEFVVLFAGVSLSLFIDKERKDDESKQRTQMYLGNIRKNLLSDTTYYNISLGTSKRIDSALVYVLTCIDRERITAPDSFCAALDLTLLIPSNHPQRGDYDGLKSTGVPEKFKEDSLWIDLQSLYESRAEILKMRTQITDNFMQNVYLPRLLPVFTFATVNQRISWAQLVEMHRHLNKLKVNSGVLKQQVCTVEFRNLITYRKMLNAYHSYGIGVTLGLSRKILMRIDRELGR